MRIFSTFVVWSSLIVFHVLWRYVSEKQRLWRGLYAGSSDIQVYTVITENLCWTFCLIYFCITRLAKLECTEFAGWICHTMHVTHQNGSFNKLLEVESFGEVCGCSAGQEGAWCSEKPTTGPYAEPSSLNQHPYSALLSILTLCSLPCHLSIVFSITVSG